MKFLVAIIALLAISAQAVVTIDIDPIKAYTGFAQELALTQATNADFTQCATAIGKVQRDLVSNKINTVADAWASWINTMLGSEAGYNAFVNRVYSLTVDGPCNNWAHAVLFTLLNGNGSFYENFWNGSSALVGRASLLRDQYLANKPVPVGQSFAYILKVLFGVVHPKNIFAYYNGLKAPVATTTEINAEIQKFVNLVAKAWGLKSTVTLDQVKKIYNPALAQYNAIWKSYDLFWAAKTNLAKEAVFSNATKAFGMAFRPIMNDIFTAGQPFMKENPLNQTQFEDLVSTIVHNGFNQAPTISEALARLGVQLQAGAPEEAAATFVALIKQLST